jgi:hypothetical protein
MTDARVSSEVVTTATVNDDPLVRVSSTSIDVGLVGDPAAKTGHVAASVAYVVDDPTLRVSDVTICVLRNPLTRHSFQAVWVD